MKQKFMELARKVSKNSDHHRAKHGAVVVKRNKVISVGFNKLKTHPKSPHEWGMLHAEIHALVGCSYDDLVGTELYIYRETVYGLANSRPCQSCQVAIKKSGIKKVHYSVVGGYQSELVSQM